MKQTRLPIFEWMADVLDIDALAMKAIVLDLAGKREN